MSSILGDVLQKHMDLHPTPVFMEVAWQHKFCTACYSDWVKDGQKGDPPGDGTVDPAWYDERGCPTHPEDPRRPDTKSHILESIRPENHHRIRFVREESRYGIEVLPA